MTDDEIQQRVTELKTNHPKFAAVVERISDLDLKETMKGYIGAEGVQKMLKFHARNLVEERITDQTSSPLEEIMTDDEIQQRVTELKTNHPKFAAVVERISDLDLKETMKGYIAAETVQKMLKFHARNLVEGKLMYR